MIIEFVLEFKLSGKPFCVILLKISAGSIFDIIHTASEPVLRDIADSKVPCGFIAIMKYPWIDRVPSIFRGLPMNLLKSLLNLQKKRKKK